MKGPKTLWKTQMDRHNNPDGNDIHSGFCGILLSVGAEVAALLGYLSNISFKRKIYKKYIKGN